MIVSSKFCNFLVVVQFLVLEVLVILFCFSEFFNESEFLSSSKGDGFQGRSLLDFGWPDSGLR